jgi:hypothetical protein
MLNPITTENAREKGEKILPITHRPFYTRGLYISLGFLEKKMSVCYLEINTQ